MKKTKTLSHWDWNDFLTAFLFFTVLVVLFYWKVLFDHSIFVFVDASRFFYPLWKWGAGVLNQGFIPLWNQDAQFGTPYFADPQMAYAYPPVPLLYSFLTATNAFAALIILHHLWALLGFWCLARAQGFSSKTALLGSFLFGFSLHVVCSSWTPVALMTISWVPWVFWAAEKVFRREKGGFLGLSFTLAMQLSAGYPVLAYLTGLALGLHFLWKTFWTKSQFHRQDTKAPRTKGFFQNIEWAGWFGAAGLVAVTYNLVWGLPFMEFFRQSNYQAGAGRYQALRWIDLATVLNPFVQGHPLGSNYHGPHYWVSTYFVGLPALCLLLWGATHLVFRKSSWGVFVVLLVLSMGETLVVGGILKTFLPGYSLVVHSGFWISLLVLWVGLMAMESIESLVDLKASKIESWIWSGVVVLIYGGSFLIGQLWNPVAFWSSGLILSVVIFVRPLFRWSFLLAATVLSLGVAADSLNVLVDRSYYEEIPVTARLFTKPGRLFFTPPLMGKAGKLEGESMTQAYKMAKESLYPDWPLTYGMEEAPIYNTLQLKGSFDWTFQAFHYSRKHSRKVLDFLGVRYVLGKSDFQDFRKVSHLTSPVEIYENPSSSPKWFSVRSSETSEALVDEDFIKADKESMDYGKTCFVADPTKAGSYNVRQVTVQTRWPNRLAFTAIGRGKALAVSSETGYPGWKALVEGKEKTVEQINHAFRGVVLNDGETRVVFHYEPLSFRLGLFFALLVFGFWSVLFLKKVIP